MAKKNTNKQYGCRKEREARKILLAEGARYVLRTRGSLGQFDLLAVYDNHTKWISVKSGADAYVKRCIREWNDLHETLPPYHVPELWVYWRQRRKWERLT